MTSFLFGREEEERVTGKNSKQAESPACTKNRTRAQHFCIITSTLCARLTSKASGRTVAHGRRWTSSKRTWQSRPSKNGSRCYPGLKVGEVELSRNEGGEKRWIIICSAKYVEVEGSSIGPVKPARMVFSDDGNFSFEVLLKCITSGTWLSSKPPHTEITMQLDTLLANSKFILCPGIREYEKEFGECVRFQSKNLRVWTLPHQRHDSCQCLLWHKPSNVQLGADSPLFDLCINCKTLYHDLQAIKKRALASSPFHKEKWTEASSNRPLKYLSPASQGKKLAKKGKEVKQLQKALSKFDDTN